MAADRSTTRRQVLTLAGAAVAVAVLTTSCSSRTSGGASTTDAAATVRSAPATTSAPAAVHAPSTSGPNSPAPAVPPSPCAKNKAAQLVLVKVGEQRVWMCERHAVVFTSAVTTGAVDLPYDATPTGTFRIQEKDRDRVLTLLSGDQYTVKYWIPFDAPLYGFHDAPWQQMPYGSQTYRTKGSHGCVHMPLRAMRYLDRWVHVGAKVTVKA